MLMAKGAYKSQEKKETATTYYIRTVNIAHRLYTA
jgi:hypothetical protein